MTGKMIRICCPNCKTALRAPRQIINRPRACPSCQKNIIMRERLPENVEPRLELLERDGRLIFALR